MGYEIKIFVGQFNNNHPEGYFSPVAMVDICKPGYESEVYKISKEPGTPCFFYELDGNTKVTEDRYQKRLGVIDLDSVTKSLRQDSKRDEYRRFKIALDVLESVKSRFKDDEIGCVLFGY